MTARRDDTIFALSTAGLPSAIAIVRASGPKAGDALAALTGKAHAARVARLARLSDPADGELIDRALTLWFPAECSETGEDLAEFHIHGSRATAAKLLAVLGAMPGMRPAEAGEFIRRRLLNGKIDLTQAEAFADLIAAETESQRRHALAIAEGGLAARIAGWREALLGAQARIEAILNFADEGDVDAAGETEARAIAARVAEEIDETLAAPPAERLRDGVRVVLAGPPNAGKSTLLNALIGRDAAIVSAVAGTTRDVIETPVVLDGIALLFSDTAGLRESGDAIEQEGVRRARNAVEGADIVLWLGGAENAPCAATTLIINAKIDIDSPAADLRGIPVSAVSGEGLAELRARIVARARELIPREDQLALNARQRQGLAEALMRLGDPPGDAVLLAESLRAARAGLEAVVGRSGVEEMLDALFSRFCIGK